jgi:hypothetical protein
VLLVVALLTLSLGACAAQPPTTRVEAARAPVEDMPGVVVRACLQAPVDLTLDPGGAPLTRYVNDIRLGYSKVGALYLSRPLCDIHGDALCRFVEAHEQAHHHTKTIGPESHCAEVLADCWAAIHSDDEALDAALAFFSSRHGSRGHYDEPIERARTVTECAAFRDRRQRMTRAVPGFRADRRLSSAALALSQIVDGAAP